MKQQIKDSLKNDNVKTNPELAQKYNAKIIFKDKFDRVNSYFKGRDLVKEVEKTLNN
jgi:hypothetical protein